MKIFRIAMVMTIGILYIFYSLAHPEHLWMARLIVLAALIGTWWLTRLIWGKEAASTSPLSADAVPSMNLSAPVRDSDPRHDS
ncbi:MAG TPA: hypothetical protein VNM92_12065 [Thermoanaerobaculia bacterium]|nr:hypothetical protein [Thermoanaerobaculia bacterium]